MSLITSIDGELASIAAGVERARALAAEAVAAAGRIVGRAAGAGFTGIASRMTRVRTAIQELHGQIGGVAAAVETARAPVRQASEQVSPQDAIRVFAPVVQQIVDVRTAAAGVVVKVGEVRTLVVAALRGGVPGPMLGRLDAIGQVMDAVVQRCGAANQHIETALAEAGLVGAAGNRAGASVYP